MQTGHTQTHHGSTVASPLSGLGAFANMTVQQRARQIREAEIIAQKTFEIDKVNAQQQTGNTCDLATAPVGGQTQK